MKVTTTELFVSKASIIHNNKYDYSKVNFTTSKTKVSIICPIHGEFFQTPNNHLTGYGCIKCSHITRSLTQSSTADLFIKKANIIHNNKYDYSKVQYKNSKTNVMVVCPEHGMFEITPSNHLHKTSPQGCPTCGILQRTTDRKYDIDTIKSLFIDIHGSRYDYSKVNYVNYNTKVTITCPIHGDFKQTPAHHINGTGCPSCAEYGFNPNKPAILYYLSINNGEAYKIGITNRTINTRFNVVDIKKIEVLFTYEFTIGRIAYNIEQQLLKTFKDYRYIGPNLLESGNTELITINILNTVTNICTSLSNNASLEDINSVLKDINGN